MRFVQPSNGDRFRPALSTWPILGSRCRPEDLYWLVDYSRAQCEERYAERQWAERGGGELDALTELEALEARGVPRAFLDALRDDLDTEAEAVERLDACRVFLASFHDDRAALSGAAERVLTEVQHVLRELEGEMNIDSVAVELYMAQHWCLEAFIFLDGEQVAKETQVRIAGERPLAICVGGGKSREVLVYHEGPEGEILGMKKYSVTGRGCYRVFEAPMRLDGGKRWPQKCPGCRGTTAKRNPLRTEVRALPARFRKFEKLHVHKRL